MQKTHTLIPKRDVTELKAKRLGYFNNSLKSLKDRLMGSFRLSETMV